jgi:hypothetical protein
MSGESAVPVVLLALAIEIMLKIRINLATGESVFRDHNHAKLFALLPDAERIMLEDRYKNNRKFPFTSTTLKDALEWSGNAFEKWRYRYEWNAVSVSQGEMVLAYNVLEEGLPTENM